MYCIYAPYTLDEFSQLSPEIFVSGSQTEHLDNSYTNNLECTCVSTYVLFGDVQWHPCVVSAISYSLYYYQYCETPKQKTIATHTVNYLLTIKSNIVNDHVAYYYNDLKEFAVVRSLNSSIYSFDEHGTKEQLATCKHQYTAIWLR